MSSRNVERAGEVPPWGERVGLLAGAAAGLHQAAEDWYDSQNLFYDAAGCPVDHQGYLDAVANRNAAAWQHLMVAVDHGPSVLAEVRATATVKDIVDDPLRGEWRGLDGLEQGLDQIVELREQWLQIQTLIKAPPGSSEMWIKKADELRNEEAWRHTAPLARQTAALARAADHLGPRIHTREPAPDLRRRAALARTATASTPRLATAPAARRSHQPPGNRHSR